MFRFTPMFCRTATALLFSLAGSLAHAEVTVQNPWVRATVAHQKVTGAFMQIIASADARLLSARSPVAGVVEIHEMIMDKEMMRMRAIDGLPLPAGKAVELAPGGYHIMLMELKAPVQAGELVPLSLEVEEGGQRRTLEVQAPARALGGMPQQGGMPAHKHGH